MANKKLTKTDRFNILLSYEEVKADPDMVAFIEHEIELLANKRTNANGERKMTAQQAANVVIKTNIVELLASDATRLFSVTEIIKEAEDIPEDMTSQRMTALLTQLIAEEKIQRVKDKRKTFFQYR